MESNQKKSIKKRAIVSFTLFALFLLLPISGKMVVAMRENLETTYLWTGIHALSGFLFAIFGVFHIVYNWQTLKHYLRRR